jgi:hypothetical protein
LVLEVEAEFVMVMVVMMVSKVVIVPLVLTLLKVVDMVVGDVLL